MEDNRQNPIPSGCAAPVKGCLITTGILLALFIALSIIGLRMTSMQDIMRCQTHIKDVGAALNRYRDMNDRYPQKLEDIVKDYLQDPSVLRCPLDKSKGDAPSYIYNPRASGKQVLLECDRHRLRKDMPVSSVVFLANGTSEVRTPSFKALVREAEKNSK